MTKCTKNILVYLIIFVFISPVFAQDWICKTDGSTIKCHIIKTAPDEIQYKKLGDTTSVFAIDRSYIHNVVSHNVYYPSPDLFSDPQKILIGIGTIIDTSDYTSATFDCFRFFADHPVVVNGNQMAQIAIIDHPSESEYAITGLIEGFIKLAVVTDEIIPPYRYNYNLLLNINIWHNGQIVKKISTNARDYLSDENGKVINISHWPPADLKYYFYYSLFEKAQKSLVDVINQTSGKALTVWNFEVPFREPPLTKQYIENLTRRKIDFYPYKTTAYFSKDREMDPWEELDEFNINFKVGLPFEKYHSIGYEANYPGTAQLNFPVWIRPEAAFEYIQIGDNFFRLNQNAMASKAYWSALTLISKTFSSRNVKEKLRMLSYAGLYNIAIRQNQNQYAGLFKLSIDMIDIYLKGQQGLDDETIFNNEMQKARIAEDLKNKAAQAAKWKGLVSVFQTGMSILPGVKNLASLSSPVDVINSGITLMGKVESEKASIAQTNQLQEEINQRLTNNYKALKSQIGDDETTALTGGGNFLSKEVVFFLATSNSTGPYLSLLKRFSVKYRNLQTALDQFENNYDPIESVINIGTEINKIEKEIILREIINNKR